MLDQFRCDVLHRIVPKKRNQMLPNMGAIVDGRRFSVLAQHVLFPLFGEVSKPRGRPWTITKGVDAFDLPIQLPLHKPFRLILPTCPEPPYVGSQRSLIPDMILELADTSFIVDAKYKRHWEELQEKPWREQSSLMQELHRADLLQVLAYANLATSRNVVCCLVYPCSRPTWDSLARRGRLFHEADLPDRGRRVRVWLTAIPMGAPASTVAAPFDRKIREAGE